MTPLQARPLRLLVVDDEAIVCDSMKMLLSFEGHSVRTANSAEAALEAFQPADIDVLITDYSMPGANGAQLAAAVRQRAPGLPVVLVTAYAEMLRSWGADLSNVDRVVSKPFRLEDLRQALADVLREVTPS